MSTRAKGILLAAGILSILVGAAPALAQSHGGGGYSRGYGGGFRSSAYT